MSSQDPARPAGCLRTGDAGRRRGGATAALDRQAAALPDTRSGGRRLERRGQARRRQGAGSDTGRAVERADAAAERRLQARSRRLFSQWDNQHKVTIDPASNGAKAIVEVGTTGWTVAHARRQGRHGVALRFGRRLRRDDRARAWPQRVRRHPDAAGDRRRRARLCRAGSDEDRRHGLCASPAELPDRKDGLYWPAAPGRAAKPTRCAGRALPARRQVRRAITTATTSACSTARGRRHRAGRTITS